MEESREEKKRPIRSFVLRQGRMTKAQHAAIDELWPAYGLSSCSGFLDLQQQFPDAEKIVFEIGFGMGGSLLEMAKASPGTGFIGVEVHRPGVGTLLTALNNASVNNIKVFSEDAHDVLAKALPDNSLDRLQLFFPDPWPKKKHHKRRIVQAAFVELVAKKLKPGGVFHVATDWQNYAEHILSVLEESSLLNTAGKNQYAERPMYRPLTKFEKRGIDLGHGVWDLLFLKE